MAEKTGYDAKLVAIGALLTTKRRALGQEYRSRERFIQRRSVEIFQGEEWISLRHLSNIEQGKNWMSIEMLIQHAYALETDPRDLFAEILQIYTGEE